MVAIYTSEKSVALQRLQGNPGERTLHALRIFQRKIYGPVLQNEEFRIRYNEELNELIKGEDIVRFIEAQRLQRLGHVERMNETAMPKRMLRGKIHNEKEERKMQVEMAGGCVL
jgi:hypothetical protein